MSELTGLLWICGGLIWLLSASFAANRPGGPVGLNVSIASMYFVIGAVYLAP